MEKKRNIGIALLVTAGLLIIFTGVVYASVLAHGRTSFDRTINQDSSDDDVYGPMWRSGMWSDDSDEYQPMRDAMIAAVSDATSLSVDEIEARLTEGEHLYTIALDSGMTEEAFYALMDEVHDSYFEQHQEQRNSTDRYEWMREHMHDEWEEHGFGSSRQNDGSIFPFDNDSKRPSGGCW